MYVMRFLAVSLPLLLIAGCNNGNPNAPGTSGGTTPPGGRLTGEILIDGSSTVAPISTAIAEEFSLLHPELRIPVGTSGTGGGFKKFSAGEIDICDASRPIKATEAEACKANGIEFIELKVAIDGLTVVVHPDNDWVESLTVEELKKLWAPESTVKKWSELKDGYPDDPIKLFGADTDSGTFDYFTEEIMGKVGAIRNDYQQSSDDNFLVSGVNGDKHALGFFGYAYYVENKSKVKAVPIAAEGGPPIAPTPETIESGTYKPLSRPLFIYVTRKALAKPEVIEFLKYYLSPQGRGFIAETGYIPLTDAQYQAELAKLDQAPSEDSAATE